MGSCAAGADDPDSLVHDFREDDQEHSLLGRLADDPRSLDVRRILYD
jgi:hypothetical protein